MSYGLAIYNSAGDAVFDSSRGDKIQRTVFETTTGTSNGSVNVPQFDSDNGHIIAYPISGLDFSENPRIVWDNSTKTLSWNFYESGRASARVFLVMYGGDASSSSGYGLTIKDPDGNSLIDPNYECLAKIAKYQVSGGTKPDWIEFNASGFKRAHYWIHVSQSTIPSTQDEAEFDNNYMVGAKLPVNGVLFPSCKNQDTVEHYNTGSSLEVMKFGIRESLPADADYGLVFNNATQDKIIITDQDRYPEVVQTWEFDTLPGVTASTGQKLRLTHDPIDNGYYIVYFNASPLLYQPAFTVGRQSGSVDTIALGIQKISNTELDVGFYKYGLYEFSTTRSPGFSPGSLVNPRFLIPTVPFDSNMDLFLRIALVRLRE